MRPLQVTTMLKTYWPTCRNNAVIPDLIPMLVT